MLLPETEVQPALEQAQRAFPNFTDWNYINQANRDYFGFTMWGELTNGQPFPGIQFRGTADDRA